MKIGATNIFLQPYHPESEQGVKCQKQPNEQAYQGTRRERERKKKGGGEERRKNNRVKKKNEEKDT